MLRALEQRFLQSFRSLRRISRILWVRVALIRALSIVAALSAEPLDWLIPDGPKDRFSQEATLPILTILANGMLAVATFSLGVMVSSHRTSAEQATPRIHRLLMEDTTTQSMLATFIGAFVFSLCAIILFRAGYYSQSAAVIVFVATVLVVLAVVVSLIRWIGQLTRIGSIEYALDRAEGAARETLQATLNTPCLGGVCANGTHPGPDGFSEFRAESSGFLCRVDMERLQAAADKHDGQVHLAVQMGDRILEKQALGWASTTIPEGKLATCFVLKASRSVMQDPRYAIMILREAASKALSPGINDQGTALEVIARIERVLWDLGGEPTETEALYPKVYVPGLPAATLPIDAFRTLARDGGQYGDVLHSLVEAVARLSERRNVLDRDTANELLQEIQAHGLSALRTEGEKERLRTGIRQAGVVN